MQIIRKILGALILFFDAISRPRKLKRSADEQAKVNKQTENYSLYEFRTCPFCVKVRRQIHKLNLHIEIKDAKNEKIAEELVAGGGKRKVPCLRITRDNQDDWMYESSDINAFLEKSFS